MRLDGNGSCIVGINMPQLDKYTVIAKRRWIDKKSENKWFCSLGSGDYTSASQSLFWFEGGLLNNVFYTYNKGYKNPIVLPELISIQSSDDYNGVHINSSNAVQADNKLFIGSVGENDNTHVVADFYQLLLFDRVLTDVEIINIQHICCVEKIYLLPNVCLIQILPIVIKRKRHISI